MKHVLVVDDDLHVGNVVEELLAREGYLVSRAYSGTEALLSLGEKKPDLVLLDLMLPGLSGEDVLPRLRGIPVIVVSAKADIDNKVALLLGGAVDYITKPFDPKELLARIAVALRANASRDATLAFENILLDPAAHSVTVAGAPVHLTRTEYAILKLLLQNPRQVITKSALLDRIAADTPDCTEGSLKIHISNLRRRLREAQKHAETALEACHRAGETDGSVLPAVTQELEALASLLSE